MKILNWIKSLFNVEHLYQSRLEQFIASKNPCSEAEIEQWIKFYQQRGGGFL